ncbi:ABC transporter ATP-binding protein [Leekyejoonella antrihumi]|uniref:ABC transporter ATP-binding protein n=1 Tax=Leekyejoonella antrihumi TaxID=1660198 RepID=A0A563DVB9_9MICO|nr:ABC transporter ATP-binding protein [Leekyejoonella antrihumi]TWP34207.1 ABC transporter ATP-binding protein [Leekyejoonella antrihumi]
MTAALTLTDITVTYPDGGRTLTALDNISLEVQPGETIAVVGPSGSGKSSLLAVAGLLLTPNSGRIEIAGEDVTQLSRSAASQVRLAQLGLVFQQSNLISSLTAREQLEMAARLRGEKGRAVRQRADELLDAVGLADAAGRRPHQLSGGQRQRVGIARALMNDPTLLLVDEPTSALDHERGQDIIRLITRVTDDRGIGTVVVTHDMGVLEHAKRLLTLEDGQLSHSYAGGHGG